MKRYGVGGTSTRRIMVRLSAREEAEWRAAAARLRGGLSELIRGAVADAAATRET